MNDRDRLLSFVTDSLDNIQHYADYRGRNFDDLIALQKELDKINESINQRLVRDFKTKTIEHLGIEY